MTPVAFPAESVVMIAVYISIEAFIRVIVVISPKNTLMSTLSSSLMDVDR